MFSKKINFELLVPEAHRVTLVGDFNTWDPNSIPMAREKSGNWKAELKLKPGRYEYKFVVDGEWWTDPANREIAQNLFGSLNSVKEVL